MATTLSEPPANKETRKTAKKMPAGENTKVDSAPQHARSGNTTLRFLGYALLTIAIVVAFLAIGSLKTGYHEDEMFTFGLSNHPYAGSITPDIQEGVTYTGSELWQDYAIVNEENAFDYGNVFENQAADVHPPLYYLLVHTVFSLFPGTFNNMYALVVNALLAAVVFWQIVWLFRRFTQRRALSVVFALLYAFTMGSVSDVIFFRMYILLSAWTIALVMLFCKYKPKEDGWRFYVLLALVLIGGTLTQYYFIIFAAFACVVYAVRIILARNWKKLVLSAVCVVAGGAVSYLIFPAMLTQIFSSGRGQEAFGSVGSGGFLESLDSYLGFLNLEVFGNLFLLLLAFGIVLFLAGRIVRRRRHLAADGSNDASNIIDGMNRVSECSADDPRDEYRTSQYRTSRDNTQRRIARERTIWLWLQLLIPVVCYVLVIAQISPLDRDRYVMNVMGIAYVLVFAALIQLAGSLSKRAANGVVGGIAFAAILAVVLSYQSGVTYLFADEAENASTVESLDDPPCLYIYDAAHKILPNYVDMASLDQIRFIQSDDLDLLNTEDYHDYDTLLLYVNNTLDASEIIEELLEDNPGLETSQELFDYRFSTAYYLD